MMHVVAGAFERSEAEIDAAARAVARKEAEERVRSPWTDGLGSAP